MPRAEKTEDATAMHGTHVNDALFPLQLLHDHFHDESGRRGLRGEGPKSLDAADAQTRAGRASQAESGFSEQRCLRLDRRSLAHLYARRRGYILRTHGSRRHGVIGCHLLLHLLPQEQRRDAGIDTGVAAARADIDSDAS